MLVVQTNKAISGCSDETVQPATSRLRTVETGRAVVQISTGGGSSIAPDVSPRVRTDPLTQAVLLYRVPPRATRTVATRPGAVPEALLADGAAVPLLTARLS